VESDDQSVTVAVVLSAREAHLLFSSITGAVHLSGPIFAGERTSRMLVAEVESFQRREGYRVPLGVRVTVRRVGAPALSCAVADLSVGGALLDPDAHPLRVGERVFLTIHLDGLERAALAGEVVRRDGERRVVRFDALAPRDDAALQKALTAAQQRWR
jgi:c-di-GMP-binding flagellar brake protein YcgR